MGEAERQPTVCLPMVSSEIPPLCASAARSRLRRFYLGSYGSRCPCRDDCRLQVICSSSVFAVMGFSPMEQGIVASLRLDECRLVHVVANERLYRHQLARQPVFDRFWLLSSTSDDGGSTSFEFAV